MKIDKRLVNVIEDSNIADWAELHLIAQLGDGNQNEAMKGNIEHLALAIQKMSALLTAKEVIKKGRKILKQSKKLFP